MSIGLKRGSVRLEPHDSAWDESAREIIYTLKAVLGSDAVDIQHIGSTAIPAILAKPIIDIVVGVRALGDMRRHDEALEAAGLIFRGSDVEGQMLYVIGRDGSDIRTHHIHTVVYGGREWNNYVNFRDYLNCHPEDAKRYSGLKEELGAKYAENRSEYTEKKMSLINELLAKAQEWRRANE